MMNEDIFSNRSLNANLTRKYVKPFSFKIMSRNLRMAFCADCIFRNRHIPRVNWCGYLKVLDVAVDIRKGSPTFGKHVAIELSGENHRQFFIPRGFAHGFSVLTDEVIFQYKCDAFYAPQSEGALAWDDPDLGIDWKIPSDKVILSEKDRHHCRLQDASWLFDYNEKLY